MRLTKYTLAALILLLASSTRAFALERKCDTAFEDCRAPLLSLIDNETAGIDVAFWFMEDSRYSTALINRFKAGVPVRVLFDSRALPGNAARQQIISDLKAAGIPMRYRTSGGILHWKMMLFVGQGTVEFSGANFSPEAFVPISPYQNYVDETIYFTDVASIVDSFKTKYDDEWTSTDFTNYANISSLVRYYPTSPIDPSLNFPPKQSFRTRSVNAYNAEKTGIDSIMYRITDRAHADAMISAVGRGVQVRVISEPDQYRDPTRLWHAWNIDRMYMAGVQIRQRYHTGLTHEKLTLLYSQGMTIFGSSNWTSPSSDSQIEHNLFTTDSTFFTWGEDQFTRKWNNTGPYQETQPFTPLPPDTPVLKVPASGATAQPTTVTLKWWAGPWAHKYDIYLGTDSSTMTKILSDDELGPSPSSTSYISWTVSGLAGGTTYYWKVVSRTMANQEKTSRTFSFTTEGSGSGGGGPLPGGWADSDVGSVGIGGSASYSSGTYTLNASGADIWGTADEFHFAYQVLSGDGSVTARVATITNTNAWTKAGVMMRDTLAANSAHASMFVTPGRGLAFQRRATAGGTTTHTSGGSGTAPKWVRVVRSGSTFSAYASNDGSSWSLVGSDTISMGSTIYVGLVLSSHDDTALATATYDNVAVSGAATSSLPSGWSNGDVGAVATAGASSYSGGTFTVTGSGADIWGTADEFQLAYTPLAGDGSIVARVASVQPVADWTKAAVMLRASLSAGSRHAMMAVSAAKGFAFQRRVVDGGTTTHTSGGSGTAPEWVKLTRSGSTISAYVSSDGSTWTLVGSDTISLPATVYAGLAVTSHADGALATATFDHVSAGP